jgi:hypothetical protein
MTDLGVPLGVGGPEDDDLVEAVLALELADVAADGLDLSGLGALDQVVRALLLVGRDEVRVVDAWVRVCVFWGDFTVELD